MNKKGQISNTQAHPVLVGGVIIFIAPMILSAVGLKVPGFIGTIGVIVIIIGVILSILKFTDAGDVF